MNSQKYVAATKDLKLTYSLSMEQQSKTIQIEETEFFLPLHHQTWPSGQAPQLLPLRNWGLGSMTHYNIPVQGKYVIIKFIFNFHCFMSPHYLWSIIGLLSFCDLCRGEGCTTTFSRAVLVFMEAVSTSPETPVRDECDKCGYQLNSGFLLLSI